MASTPRSERFEAPARAALATLVAEPSRIVDLTRVGHDGGFDLDRLASEKPAEFDAAFDAVCASRGVRDACNRSPTRPCRARPRSRRCGACRSAPSWAASASPSRPRSRPMRAARGS
jgi:hypothetical protein